MVLMLTSNRDRLLLRSGNRRPAEPGMARSRQAPRATPDHRRPESKPAPGGDDLGGFESHSARRLQVLQLRRRQLQLAGCLGGAAGCRPRVGPPHRPATRHQLLHLPINELLDRCLPGRGDGFAQSDRLRLLRFDVPAAGRRTDHPILGDSGPAPEPHAHAREIRARRLVLRPGHGQEDSARQPVRQDRRYHLRRRIDARTRRLVRRRGVLRSRSTSTSARTPTWPSASV